jgi:putative transposase
LLIPNVKRTWAFRGQTPHVPYLYKQDRISAFSALAVSPERKRLSLYVRLRTHNLAGLDVISFLRHLFKHLRGPIFLLWDRGTIHKRVEVRDYLAKRRRVHVEWFPAYAPELNPAELVWNKNDSDLANGAPLNLRRLSGRLHNSMRRIRGSQKLLWSCIHASDLPWKRR